MYCHRRRSVCVSSGGVGVEALLAEGWREWLPRRATARPSLVMRRTHSFMYCVMEIVQSCVRAWCVCVCVCVCVYMCVCYKVKVEQDEAIMQTDDLHGLLLSMQSAN